MERWYGLLEPLAVLVGLGVLLYYGVWKNPYEIEKREKRKQERNKDRGRGKKRD